MNNKKDLITKIVLESQAYQGFSDIEKLVESGVDLSVIPVQPLYLSLQTTSADQIALVLPKLSYDQRKSLLELDLWHKDDIDVNSFEHWTNIYSKCEDEEISGEFVKGEEFLLFLKSRFHLHTFDAEEPRYPDHDYYFLTEDNLLLIEYDKEFQYIFELKKLVKQLYSEMGVENAYAHLFKVLSDSFLVWQEDQFYRKKEHLRDYGFVDYYEALEKTAPLANLKQINAYISKKEKATGGLDPEILNQSLHSSSLISFNGESSMTEELTNIADDKRSDFLHFNFVRLINATITLEDALKQGRIGMTKVGKKTKATLELGYEYIKDHGSYPTDENLFDYYEFNDLYKVGYSLIQLVKKNIKSALRNSPFEEDVNEYFLGTWWVTFVDNSFLDYPAIRAYGAGKAEPVNNLKSYSFWKDQSETLLGSVSFINGFYSMYQQLVKEGKLSNDFYINYNTENIDYEAILISSYVNFSLGNFSEGNANKMGVTINELKKFTKLYFDKLENEYLIKPSNDEEIINNTNKFIEKFGFNEIPGIYDFIYGILNENLNGYELDDLAADDFKHVGGPIILNLN